MSGRVPAGNGRLMSEAGVPIATICVDIPGSALPFVMVDDQLGVAHASSSTSSALGHRRFGYISGPAGNRNEIGRRDGFVAGLAAAGLDPGQAIYWQGDFMIESGVGAAREFLALTERPTAVYAVSDSMAISFMKTVMEAGVRVPEDVSVVGFDGIEFAEFVTPTLTTIQQPRHEIGRTGARVLLEALGEGNAAAQREARLRRSSSADSTAPPRRAVRTDPPAGLKATRKRREPPRFPSFSAKHESLRCDTIAKQAAATRLGN